MRFTQVGLNPTSPLLEFKITLNITEVKHDEVWIPIEASNYFPIGPAPVTITHCGNEKSYSAKVYCEYRNKRKIYDGWRDFIRDGGIREGDVLVVLITYSNFRSVFLDVKHVIPV
ncbi:hypothetical protein FXO38_13899 [Capsicum annuum]|nr:hypothetical protein FXO38_13899 [Capsicum annuum]